MRIKLCLLIAILVLAPCAFAAPVSQPASGLPSTLGLAIATATRIAPDVWVAKLRPGLWVHTTTHRYPDGTVYPANGMLLETAQGSILFDTGWQENQTRTLLHWAKVRLHKPVNKAFVTHFHGDRMGGIGALTRSGIRVYGLKLTRDLALRRKLPVVPQAMANLEIEPYRDAAGFELFYPGAGHTRDNIVVYFTRQRVLFGGCLLKSVTDSTLGNMQDAVLADWPLAVRRVRARYMRTAAVVPGHGTIGGGALERTLKLLLKARPQPAPTVQPAECCTIDG